MTTKPSANSASWQLKPRTPRIDRPDYECSTSGTIVLVHPYTSERKPIALCEANMPTYYALLEAGWLDDNEMSTIGYAAPATTDAANAHSDHENEGNEDSHVSK